jgi:hypothetical protein
MLNFVGQKVLKSEEKVGKILRINPLQTIEQELGNKS